jgi:hypothetical protein
MQEYTTFLLAEKALYLRGENLIPILGYETDERAGRVTPPCTT